MESTLQRKLYSRILVCLSSLLGAQSEEELCRNLRPAYSRLWNSYRDDSVVADYSTRDSVAAYMLAYFPNYVFMSRRGLAQISQTLGERVKAAIVCGGPAPELLGLVSLLAEGSSSKEVSAEIFDVNAAYWSWGGSITTRLCEEFCSTIGCTARYIESDMSAAVNAPPSSTFDLVIAQNCLNELTQSRVALTNLVELSMGIRSGGYVAVLDQGNYERVHDAVAILRKRFGLCGFESIEASDTPWILKPDLFVPPVVVDNLFDGRPSMDDEGNWKPGRYVRRTINAISLIMRKR